MFLEFTEGVKGYRLWHPIEKRCINSMDVIFREQEMFMFQDKPVEEHRKDEATKIKVELNSPPSTSRTDSEDVFEETESQDGEEATEMPEESQDLQNYSLSRDR